MDFTSNGAACSVPRSMKWIRMVLLASSIVTPSSLIRAADFFEIAATIESRSFRYAPTRDGWDKVVAADREFPVKCVVSLDEWRIESGFDSNYTEIAFFDGTNTVTFLRRGGTGARVERLSGGGRRLADKFRAPIDGLDPMLYQLANEGRIALTDISSVTVCEGNSPLRAIGLNVPWLAFCSARFLKTPGRVIPLPVRSSRVSLDSFGYRDETTLFEDGLGLPQRIRFYTDLRLLGDSVNDERLSRTDKSKMKEVAARMAGTNDMLKCEYEALATTNWMGWTIPSEFRLRQFEPVGTKAQLVRYEITGRLTSIQESSRPVLGIPEGVPLHVLDYRFRSKRRLLDAIEYATNAERIPVPLSDERLKTVFRVSEAAAPRDPEQSFLARHVNILRGVVLILVCIPFLVFVIQRLPILFRRRFGAGVTEWKITNNE